MNSSLPRVHALAVLHAAAIATALCVAEPALAQRSACNPGLRPVQDHPLGYRQRGDRCEGIYWQPHASDSAIVVLSVMPASTPLASVLPEVLRVSWPAQVPGAVDGEVQLEAASLRRGLFYRMDAFGSLKSGRYDWATDVVRGLGLGGSEVSLQARAKVRLGGISWTALLPVWLDSPVSPTTQWRLRLVSTVALHGLAWECLGMDAASSGMPGKTVASGKLPGPFRSDEAFAVSMTLPVSNGYCYLDITGEPVTAQAGGAPKVTAVIFIPGGAETRGARP